MHSGAARRLDQIFQTSEGIHQPMPDVTAIILILMALDAVAQFFFKRAHAKAAQNRAIYAHGLELLPRRKKII
jgi:hypothetical protein